MLGLDYIKRLFGTEHSDELLKTPEPEKGYFDLSSLENETENIKVDSFADVGGVVGYGVQSNSGFGSIKELVKTYREMSVHSEIDDAISEIVNECVVKTEDDIVDIDLDNVDLSDNIKEEIIKEFGHLLYIMDFKYKGDEIFRQWYVDGRLYTQNIFNPSEINDGIVDMNILSPYNLSRIKSAESGKQYYVYKLSNEDKVTFQRYQYDKQYDGFIIPDEHINFTPSGLKSPNNEYYLSHLHKAMKPYNNLKLVEDSSVMLRLTHGIEKRIFKIATGRMTPAKAEEYVKKLMNSFRNRVTYDSTTGGVLQQKNVMTMNEDFWIPIDSEGKGTSIDLLQGTQNLSEMGDIEYHRRKLLGSLYVPYGRFSSTEGSSINFGDNSKEVARDEMRFAKFNNSLKDKFSRGLFIPVLKKHLIAKNIIDLDEWIAIEKNIQFNWAKDQYYEEIAQQERLKGKIELLNSIGSQLGKKGYFSKAYVYREILKMTEDEVKEMRDEIKFEEKVGEVATSEEGFESEFGAEPSGFESDMGELGGGEESPLEAQPEPPEEEIETTPEETT